MIPVRVTAVIDIRVDFIGGIYLILLLPMASLYEN